MGKLAKLITKFLQEPPEVRFDDGCYVLTAFGFEEKRAKGSHHMFRNSEGVKITVPKKGGRIVKGVYVKHIVELLNLEDWQDESADDTKLESLADYLKLNYPITLYPEPDGGYTVMLKPTFRPFHWHT